MLIPSSVFPLSDIHEFPVCSMLVGERDMDVQDQLSLRRRRILNNIAFKRFGSLNHSLYIKNRQTRLTSVLPMHNEFSNSSPRSRDLLNSVAREARCAEEITEGGDAAEKCVLVPSVVVVKARPRRSQLNRLQQYCGISACASPT